MYRNLFKDIFDFYLAIILFIFFFPLMAFIYVILNILIGSPIYTQKRPGFLNKPFIIFKFKTLIDRDCKNFKKDKNTFKFGTFLRKTGIDELPQLLNILKGEMSFIGPRPLLFEYLKKYSKKEKKRHLVKPGITGLAQVNPDPSGNKIWKKSIKLDLYYVKEVSFALDIEIVLKTIGIILLKKKQYKDFKKFYEK